MSGKMEKYTEVQLLDCHQLEAADPERSFIRVFQGKIEEFVIIGGVGVFVSERGEVYRMGNWDGKFEQSRGSFSHPQIIEELSSYQVKSLACNSSVIHAITGNSESPPL